MELRHTLRRPFDHGPAWAVGPAGIVWHSPGSGEAHMQEMMARRVLVAAGIVLVGLVGTSCDTDDGDADLAITTLSTRPEAVTGGDVLVAIEVSEETAPDAVDVTIAGERTEVQLERDADGTLVGLVTGLPDGETTIEVEADGARGTLDVVNHPTTGPVLSGPHIEIPVCTTEANGLGPPVDELCSAETVTTLRWADADGAWHDAADASAVPADAMRDAEGEPLHVTREIGTINRAVYWLDVPANWNGRLVYQFGGGCGTGYTQGFRLLPDPTPELLAAGYATATATFNTFQVMCNNVLSAETTMMVKEHFAETVGVPDLTIGQGGSGGAIQQYFIIQNYPGILDAASVSAPFPDAVTIAADVLDCALLARVFAEPGLDWTPEKQLAAQGHLTAGTCTFWDETFAGNVNPSEDCSLDLLRAASGALEGIPPDLPSLPPEAIYDPVENPDGFRCTLQDANENMLGTDEETGFALRAWDNVGVQYGLGALNDGSITVDQFLDLNETIGSFDIDGQLVDDRSEAPEQALETAYETGHVLAGGGDLDRIPIVTVNVFTDREGDIHTRDRAFALRERLRDDGDDPPNHLLWTRPGGDDLIESLTGTADVGVAVIELLDEWATALAADESGEPSAETIEQTRPDDAVDTCITPDGDELRGADVYDQDNTCTDAYPVSGSPRTVAGAPLRNDVIKCELRSVAAAIDAGVYEVDLSEAERVRLEAVFPDGVCDYAKPGVGRVPVAGPWLSYPRT